MKILLLSIDSKLPNIALHKLEMWHRQQGDEVFWDMPIMLNSVDKTYASCIFTKNKVKVENYLGLRPDLIVGGTGYDLTVKLPSEIEEMKPLINYGFTTRGCIRNCPFCCVPLSEGRIRIVGDIYTIWDKQSKSIILLDNNILALPDHFAIICQQLINENLAVDFNQGLDIRLVNDEVAQWLFCLKYSKQLRFSFDFSSIEKQFREGMDCLKRAGIRMSKIMVYVLVGFNTTPDQDFERLEIIKEYGADAFIMIYQEVNGIKPRMAEWLPPKRIIPNIRCPRGNFIKYNRYIREFANWVNHPLCYKVMNFEDWIKIRGLK